MKVGECRNTTLEAINARKYNIWIGISLGNKYFNKEHIKSYLQWSLSVCKDSVLIVIADQPHAINYEVFDLMESKDAMEKAVQAGEKVLALVETVISTLPESDKNKIKVIRWNDISFERQWEERASLMHSFYRHSKDFHDRIIKIVRTNLAQKIKPPNESQTEKLAKYVLLELPLFMGALEHNGIEYDLHIYPGLSEMDDLVLGIQSGDLFPELGNMMTFGKQLAIAEVYAD